MYEIAIIALLILAYSIFAEKIETYPISGPIIFLFVGIITGPLVLIYYQEALKKRAISFSLN